MSGANSEVQILVTLRDSASKQLLQQLGMINAETGKISASAEKMGGSFRDVSGRLRDANGQFVKMGAESTKVANATDQIGRGLNDRLKTALGTAKQIGTMLSQGVAGWEAMKAVGGAIIKPTVDYETQLANMVNTAYAGKTVQEKEVGLTEMHNAVKSAIAQSGGTREQGVAALDKILASGVFNEGDKGVQERAKNSGVSAEVQARNEALKVLPTILAGAKAANAQPDEVAGFVLKGIQQGYFQPDQAGMAIDKALVAAQAGGFEFKDMAKHLGEQLAIGKLSGLNGMEGFERILAMNQAGFTAAGSGDEAANNVTNLLAKLNSDDTKKDFKKQAGIDLDAELKKGALKGEDSLMVVTRLLQQQLASNKDYQSAQAQLKGARENKDAAGVEKAMTAIAAIAQGTTVGKFFQDRQALTGLIPMLDPTYMNSIMAKTANAGGATQNNIDFLKNQTAWSMEQGKNSADNARFESQRGAIGSVVGGANEAFTNMSNEFPALTGALLSLKDATLVAASVYGAVSLTGILGKGGLGGVLGKTAGTVAGAEAAGGAAAAAGGAGSLAAPAALVAIPAALTAWLGTSVGNDNKNNPELKRWSEKNTPWATSQKPQDSAASAPQQGGGLVQTQALFQGFAAQLAQLSQAGQGGASGQALIQSNAQLQQVNSQMAQLVQVSNNAPLQASLQAVQGGIAALNAKNYSMTATIPVYIDGSMVAQHVNTVNANQAARG